MGKVKSPVSDKLDRNLEQATYYIDLLDMLQTKMKGNLSEWEEQYIIHSLSELKLNFIEEQKKGTEATDDSQSNDKSESSAKGDKAKPKAQKPKATKSKSKSTKKKPK